MSGREGLLAGGIQLFTKSLSSPTFYLTLTDDPGAGPFWGHILRNEKVRLRQPVGARPRTIDFTSVKMLLLSFIKDTVWSKTTAWSSS